MRIMNSFGIRLGEAQAPRSVEQITKVAQDYEYDAAVPLKYWLRTASALLKEVSHSMKVAIRTLANHEVRQIYTAEKVMMKPLISYCFDMPTSS